MNSFDDFDFGLTLVSVSEVSRNKAQMQQPNLQSEALPEPSTKAPGDGFSFAPPADGWGLRIGFFSRKFRESSAKKWAKVNMHFEGSGPVSLANKS